MEVNEEEVKQKPKKSKFVLVEFQDEEHGPITRYAYNSEKITKKQTDEEYLYDLYQVEYVNKNNWTVVNPEQRFAVSYGETAEVAVGEKAINKLINKYPNVTYLH